MNISYQKLDNGIAKTLLNISARLESILVAIGKLGAWLSLPLIAIIMFDIISRKFFVLGSTKLQEMEWHLHAALLEFTHPTSNKKMSFFKEAAF